MTQSTCVETVIKQYADRGYFRQLTEQRNGRAYEFFWINDTPMRLTWSPQSATLQFQDLLPNVPPRSELSREVRKFLAARFETKVPEHRRLDPERVTLVCANRKSSYSVGLKLADAGDEYGPRKLVNLVHEMFVYLNMAWPEYMYESFDQSME